MPRPATKWVIAGQVGEQLGAGALLVGERVGRVAVLVEHHPVGVLVGDLLGHPDGLVGAAGGGRGDDLGAPHPQQLAALLGGVLRHHADDPVALELGRHRQRDAGVARGRLEDRAAGAQRARPSPPPRSSSGPARSLIEPVGLRSSSLAHSRTSGVGRQPRQPHQRGVADRGQEAVVAHALQHATAISAGSTPGRTTSSGMTLTRGSGTLKALDVVLEVVDLDAEVGELDAGVLPQPDHADPAARRRAAPPSGARSRRRGCTGRRRRRGRPARPGCAGCRCRRPSGRLARTAAPAGSPSPAAPARTSSGSWPCEALRKNRPVTGCPHTASAYCVTRSQRGRSSGVGRRLEQRAAEGGVDVLAVDEDVGAATGRGGLHARHSSGAGRTGPGSAADHATGQRAPPATAGSTTTWSPSLSSASRPPMKRTSSSLM